jgi:hypothetical protein
MGQRTASVRQLRQRDVIRHFVYGKIVRSFHLDPGDAPTALAKLSQEITTTNGP